MTNREKAENFLRQSSSGESWIDASSEFIKARLTELLDEVAKEARKEAREGMRPDHGCLDIESGLLDD